MSATYTLKTATRLCLLAVLAWGTMAPVQAQDRGRGATGLTDMGSTGLLQQLRQRFSNASMPSGTLALEGALNPAEYIVGPGDQFSVSIGGVVPKETIIQVSADGTLPLSEIGAIDAAGQTLETVQIQALALLHQQYRNTPVEVTLAQPRQFYVHLSGVVPEPGRYLMIPLARVSDALEFAYAAKLPYLQTNVPKNLEGVAPPSLSASSERPALQSGFRPSLRNVWLTHRDGAQQSIDLFRYYTTGDMEHNPYLLDGDIITVPAYNVNHEAISVTGAVPYPGLFDYRPDDTALDVLLLAIGPNALTPVNEVRLTRRGPDGIALTTILDIPAIRSGVQPAVPLQPGDHLNVLKQNQATAAIYGFVQYPGTYPIKSRKTTLRSLLELAGGLKPDANVRAAYIERKESNYFKDNGRISDLDFFDRAYLQHELRRNRIAINIEDILQPDGPDFVLQNKDTVVFPRDEETVFVTGNVVQPGYVQYIPGKDARYYVEAAGGAGTRSTGIYIFEAGTGAVHTEEALEVYSGDTIFVNRDTIAETPELQSLLITDQASKRQTRILNIQTVIAGVSTIAAIITAFAAITR